MITQVELEELGFVLQGVFGDITRYRFRITREDIYFSDTYSEYYFEIDETKDDIHRLYGQIVRGLDFKMPTTERKTTYTTIDEVETDLKKYLRKDLLITAAF